MILKYIRGNVISMNFFGQAVCNCPLFERNNTCTHVQEYSRQLSNAMELPDWHKMREEQWAYVTNNAYHRRINGGV